MAASLQNSLEDAERCIAAIAAQLVTATSAQLLESSCRALHEQALKLSVAFRDRPTATTVDQQLRQRLRCIASDLGVCQAQLARRAALNRQGLEVLVPAARAQTYGTDFSRRVGSRYGSAGRQSGEFHTVSV